jgi:hypothetical protein
MSSGQWKTPFLQLQQNIRPLIELKHRLFYANVVLPFHDRAKAVEFANDLEPAYMDSDLVGIVETPTEGCKFHGHLYYGDTAVFQQMESLLGDLHSWVADMPTGLLPALSVPRTDRQTLDNLALWSNLLLILASRHSRWHFAADVEFQQQLDQSTFCIWEELQQPPHLNPMAVLTHQNEIAVPFVEWPRLFANEQLRVPEYFGAYLRDAGSEICGDFLKASMSAIDVIVYMLSEQFSQTPKSRSSAVSRDKRDVARKSRSDRAQVLEGQVFSFDATSLLLWLLAHHGCSTDDPKSEAFDSQSRVARELTIRGNHFNQIRVSRSLKELMSHVPNRRQVFEKDGRLDGDKTYQGLCQSGDICGVLNSLYLKHNQSLDQLVGELRNEYGSEKIEGYSSRGF